MTFFSMVTDCKKPLKFFIIFCKTVPTTMVDKASGTVLATLASKWFPGLVWGYKVTRVF